MGPNKKNVDVVTCCVYLIIDSDTKKKSNSHPYSRFNCSYIYTDVA
jgi:hypothetical protein